jgi:hypothetical protein
MNPDHKEWATISPLIGWVSRPTSCEKLQIGFLGSKII